MTTLSWYNTHYMYNGDSCRNFHYMNVYISRRDDDNINDRIWSDKILPHHQGLQYKCKDVKWHDKQNFTCYSEVNYKRKSGHCILNTKLVSSVKIIILLKHRQPIKLNGLIVSDVHIHEPDVMHKNLNTGMTLSAVRRSIWESAKVYITLAWWHSLWS